MEISGPCGPSVRYAWEQRTLGIATRPTALGTHAALHPSIHPSILSTGRSTRPPARPPARPPHPRSTPAAGGPAPAAGHMPPPPLPLLVLLLLLLAVVRCQPLPPAPPARGGGRRGGGATCSPAPAPAAPARRGREGTQQDGQDSIGVACVETQQCCLAHAWPGRRQPAAGPHLAGGLLPGNEQRELLPLPRLLARHAPRPLPPRQGAACTGGAQGHPRISAS